MKMPDLYDEAMQRLTKWRTILAGWQLGTRAQGDPECDAVRDHRELTLLLRAEVTAITRILIEKDIVSLDDFRRILAEEAEHLNAAHERRFPGIKTTSYGLEIDVTKAAPWWRNFKP